MSDLQAMNERMDELESRLAFQDDLVTQLNDVVARQDQLIAGLERRLASLESKIEELAESSVTAGASGGHEVPPHY